MAFNKCSINGVLYGDIKDKFGNTIDDFSGYNLKPLDFSYNRYYETKFKFYDKKLQDDTNNKVVEVERFWRLLALCHTVSGDSFRSFILCRF